MSEKICTLRGAGGGAGAKQTETVLWTNSAPTSAFAAQTVTLSQSMSNFDYLAFRYKFNATTETTATAIYKVEDVKNSILSGSTYRDVIGLDIYVSSSHSRSRQVGYVSDTSIQFLTSYRLNSASSDDNACIPLSIIGIKNMGGNGAINLSGFTFQFKAHTNNASGNNRTYINLPIGHINSFRITGISGSYSAIRFGWKGDSSASTDVVLNTVYTKPSDATELAIWVAVLNSTCTVTMEIID